ncbi:MAG: branched-chain amino acid ABC transporter permease [Chloroflexia bacterium]
MRDRNASQSSASGAVDVSSTGLYRSRTEEALRNILRNPVNAVLLSLLLAVVLTYPFLDEWLNLKRITDVIPIMMYILLALGLNVVVGYAGLLDLGYAAFFAIGAYTAALLTSPQSPLNLPNMQWFGNFWFSMVVAFVVAILAGVILGAPTLRLRGDYLAIVTLGFGEIVPVVFRNATDVTYGERGLGAIGRPAIDIGFLGINFDLGGSPVFGLGNWSTQLPWYYFFLIVGALAIFGLRRLQNSRVGRAWMAIREDEIAASAMGVNLVTTKLSAFGMGASLSGVVGAMYGGYINFVHPSAFEFSTSVILLCAVILGGLGNIWGVILGGFIIQFFDRIMAGELTGLLNDVGTQTGIEFLATIELGNWRFFIFGAALVIMMLLRPQGLLPNARRAAELKPEDQTIQGAVQAEAPGYAGPGIEPTPESVQARETLYDVRDQDDSIQEKR